MRLSTRDTSIGSPDLLGHLSLSKSGTSISIMIADIILLVMDNFFNLKGASHQILLGIFLARMDRSGEKRKPLLVFKISVAPSIFGGHFKVLKCFILKNLRDSWNLRDEFTYLDTRLSEISYFLLDEPPS